MTPSKIIFLLPATIWLFAAACHKPITPPRLDGFPLPQHTETFRDWRSFPVCDADERLVERELTRFVEFADTFLQDTSGKTKLSEGQQIALLDASSQLKPLFDGFGNLVFQGPNCTFSKNPRILSLIRRASGLLSLSRQRTQQARTLIQLIEENSAIALWRKNRPAIIEKARKEWCPPQDQHSPVPDLFYVSEDETLHKEWLFCDGTKMVAELGKENVLILPRNPPPRHKRYSRRLYHEAAESYPDNQIQRPPKSNDRTKEKTP